MKRWLLLAALVLTWTLAAHGQETFKNAALARAD